MKPDSFVLDASALLKRCKQGEPHGTAFRDWADAAQTAGADFLAPTLLRYELGNALAKESRRNPALSPSHRRKMLEYALVGFRFADPDDVEGLAPPLSFYDAAYVILARETRATLVTYDVAVLAAAKAAGVPTLSPQ